jgi:hypothetical protein
MPYADKNESDMMFSVSKVVEGSNMWHPMLYGGKARFIIELGGIGEEFAISFWPYPTQFLVGRIPKESNY